MADIVEIKATKPPLFQPENLDAPFDSMLRSGRFNSADIVKDVEKRRKRKSSKSKSKKSSQRSKSVGDTLQFMSPLATEKLDVLSTPLSSLRSCSEYNRGNTAQGFIPKAVENEVRKGFWSTFFFWSSDYNKSKNTTPKKKQHRVRFRSRDNAEQSFLVERLRFNEANLIEGEDYDYRSSNNPSFSFASPSFSGVPSSSSSTQHRRRHRSTSSDASFNEDSPYDYFFGVKVPSISKLPMEIELKTIRIEYFDVYTEPSTTSAAAVMLSRNNSLTGAHSAADILHHDFHAQPQHHLQLQHPSLFTQQQSTPALASDVEDNVHSLHIEVDIELARPPPSPPGSPLVSTPMSVSNRLVTSFHTLERIPLPSATATTSSTSSSSSPLPPTSILVVHPAEEVLWWHQYRSLGLTYWQHFMTKIRQYTHASQDNVLTNPFYEILRMQPFSCGGYLRGMLLAGLSSTLFQVYNVITWPELVRPLATSTHWIPTMLFIFLCLQILLNILNFPWRLKIHFLCWEAARSVETEQAMHVVRTMLASDAWLLNRWLGYMIDSLSLINLVFTEIYLWMAPVGHLSVAQSASVHNIVISLCATNLLMFVCRIVVSVMYAWSLHDPHVMSEVRRRGLSKFDVDALPTLVFAAKEDASTEDCAICLSAFELGEMLIALPCDRQHQHCFHAPCIRTWLTRQNSCPLCQRVI